MNKVKKVMTLALLAIASVSCTAQTTASVQDQLDTATKEGKTVLVVVSDKDNPSADLKALAQSATANEKNVAIIEMDKDSAANSALVSEYHIGSAPMPLLLVFSNKGMLLGGMTEEQATKEAITEALPTPKYSEMISVMSEGKSVIAVVSNSAFESDKAAKTLSQSIAGNASNNVSVITIDAEDSEEAKLIKMLNIKEKLKDSYIVAINGQGMMTGRFDKLPSEKELLDAATMVVQTGCGVGGCGPTCN